MTQPDLDRVLPRDILLPEWIVLRAIAKTGENGIHVSALAHELRDEMSKVTVIKALASLEQRGMTQARWMKEGGWKRKYFVSDPRVEGLVKKKLEPLFAISAMDLQK